MRPTIHVFMASGVIARYLKNRGDRNAPYDYTEHLRSYALEITYRLTIYNPTSKERTET